MLIDWSVMVQESLFENQHVPRAARGPVQSQLTLASLGKDTTLKSQIAFAVWALSSRPVGVTFDRAVTDDCITDFLERRHGRRFQRNVVARTRGLMEVDGWFDPVPDVIGRTGRPTHAVVASASLIALYSNAQ